MWIIIKASLAEFILSKVPCFQHILQMPLKYDTYSLKGILFKTFKNTQVAAWNLEDLVTKTFEGNILKISHSSYLANNWQKATLPVVSRSSVGTGLARPFYVPYRVREYNYTPKNLRAMKLNLSRPVAPSLYYQ